MFHENVANHWVAPSATVVKANPDSDICFVSWVLQWSCTFRASSFLPLMYFVWKQEPVVGHSARGNYLKRDCIDVTQVVTEEWLKCCTVSFSCSTRTASVVWPWPLCLCTGNECHKKINLCKLCYIACRCRFGSMIVFAIITELKGLGEWFHWILGSWDWEAKTGHSHLISTQSFPKNNTAGAPGKWERNVTFPCRLRGMWHGVDGFCRIGTAKACLSSEAGMWVSELISTNKACSGPSYSMTTEPDWNNSL